jgi:retron-type reverse transcriptase
MKPKWVIDLDLEKFFDRVNHGKLMGQIAKRIGDKRRLKLIRAFLKFHAIVDDECRPWAFVLN